jgi:hypothetical protein
VDGVLTFPDDGELAAWAREHAAEAGEAEVAFERVRYGSPAPSLRYDAAAAALADVGWIGYERRVLDDGRVAVRFAPGTVKKRRPPAWATAGSMPEPELSREQEERFRADAEAWAFFGKQPPRYRRAAVWWVTSGKSEETRERRLETLVEASAAGEKVPAIVRGL